MDQLLDGECHEATSTKTAAFAILAEQLMTANDMMSIGSDMNRLGEPGYRVLDLVDSYAKDNADLKGAIRARAAAEIGRQMEETK